MGDENGLDAEFCQILYMIKPYISNINDHYRLEKYRVWLEKLSNTGAAEKLERNKYLVELANQIYDDVLRPPFSNNPPLGPLPPLKILERKVSKRYQEEELEITWPYFSSDRRTRRSLTQIKRAAKIKTVGRPFQTLGKVKDSPKNSETSSWCDISESGASEEKEEQIKVAERPPSPPGNIEDAKNLYRQRAREELNALKMRVEDLVEVKNALKKTNSVSEDRKKTIDGLQNRVAVLAKENAELKALLDSTQKKYSEMDKVKLKELGEFKQKLSTSRMKELEKIKQQHQEQIKSIEKKHESKIEAVKNEYEEKIKELTDLNERLSNENALEISRLKNELKNRGDCALNEQNSEHVIVLKKCLSKVDRALQKTEKEYIKKIEKLKQELEMREMTSKMQLQTQRSELVLEGTAQKQDEMKKAIENLEGKYKKMVEFIQFQGLKTRKQDEKTIKELRSLLEKHNITYSIENLKN